MEYLRRALEGIAAVVILVISANAGYMLYWHIALRNDPFVKAGDVRIQWGPGVNGLIVRSPLFWIAVALILALVGWLRFRHIAKRRVSIVRSPHDQITR